MSKKPKTEVMVGVVEASIRILIDHGFTRDEALQLMLSQIAVQVSPEIMRLGVTLSENHHEDFAKAEWRGGEDAAQQNIDSIEYALGPL